MASPAAAAIVDWQALLEVIAVSIAGGVGVTAAFSIALAGATRFADSRREGRGLAAGAFAIVAILGLAACAAAIGLGLVIMVSK